MMMVAICCSKLQEHADGAKSLIAWQSCSSCKSFHPRRLFSSMLHVLPVSSGVAHSPLQHLYSYALCVNGYVIFAFVGGLLLLLFVLFWPLYHTEGSARNDCCPCFCWLSAVETELPEPKRCPCQHGGTCVQEKNSDNITCICPEGIARTTSWAVRVYLVSLGGKCVFLDWNEENVVKTRRCCVADRKGETERVSKGFQTQTRKLGNTETIWWSISQKCACMVQ